MNRGIRIELLTPELRAMMEQASAADHGHCAPLATHVFLKSDQVVGAVALFAPTLTFWAQSTGLTRREAVYMAQTSRALGLTRQAQFLVACSPESPYHPIMPHLGFQRLGNADYFEVNR